MKNKKFDCVDWVRQIRNEDYEEYGHLTIQEYLKIISEQVQNSDLFKDFVKKGMRVISPIIAQTK